MINYIQTDRRIDTKNNVVNTHSSLNTFLEKPTIQQGINSIWHGGLPIDLLFANRGSDTLVVVLNGAPAADLRLPWLAGGGITSGLEVSRVSISDPTLYMGSGFMSTWYSGNKHQPELQHDLVKIFRKVADSAGAKNIVFLGGSSGGFAALRFSHDLPGSTAVVFNPQTNLRRHSPAPVDLWLNKAWGLDTLDELPNSVTVDLTELYSGSFLNRVVYMQNETDHHHGMHFLPFLERATSGDLQHLVHDESPGHTPPPKDMLRKVLEQACDTAPFGTMPGFQSA